MFRNIKYSQATGKLLENIKYFALKFLNNRLEPPL